MTSSLARVPPYSTLKTRSDSGIGADAVASEAPATAAAGGSDENVASDPCEHPASAVSPARQTAARAVVRRGALGTGAPSADRLLAGGPAVLEDLLAGELPGG